ncbi:MAG: hypothetical protein J6Q41_01825 [Firmicutes bacterium]|nr:hypothetical protein [Bacillota bacterium]
MSDSLKKFLALILCVAMVFCFAACGSDDAETGDDEDEATTEEQVDPEDPTGEGAEPEADTEEEDEPVDVTQETQNLEDKEADLMALQKAAEESDEPYTGTYVEVVAGRGIIIINKVADVYSVVINWSDSAFESYEWVFSGDFDDEGVLEYDDCIKKDIVYEVEEEGTVSKVYENGTGRLRLTDEGVIWEDDIEHTADDANFILMER